MKLLVFNWGYTIYDIKETLNNMGVSYRTFGYQFADKNHDDFFVHRLTKILNEDSYDAVLSVNYFPLIAECCKNKNLKYISWSYDNPLNVLNIEETLEYETNYVFLFDRIQVETFRSKGFINVWHMPLGVNIRRLDTIRLTAEEKQNFDADISFVGKLYNSDYSLIMSALSDYQRGYIESVIKTQAQLYGTFILNEVIPDSFVEKISKEAMLYAISAQITREERLLLLGLLSKEYKVNLYSREENTILKNVNYRGSCGYLQEMPRIFKASKISLNITLKIIQSGIPLRCLDILGAGGFLISNWQQELNEYFSDGDEVVLYQNIDDLIEKVEFYIKHDEIREKIALKGHDRANELFNYEIQLKRIFEVAKVF